MSESRLIETEGLGFDYIRRDDEGGVEAIIRALDGVTMSVCPGDFVAILGANGSGKSTLAKHLNAILVPTDGTVYVDGLNTRDGNQTLEIRKRAGMVFQNPDNQIIGQIVEEDVGFGPENLGVPTKEIWDRVEESLKAVGMYEFRKSSPNKLSGGQKQRVSIAGILAMHPKCIILDEPTAMLDPIGRKEVLKSIRALNQVENITVLLITHHMDEVIYANKVLVMDSGRVAMEGTPREIFSKAKELEELRLEVPYITRLAIRLRELGINVRADSLTVDELSESIRNIYRGI